MSPSFVARARRAVSALRVDRHLRRASAATSSHRGRTAGNPTEPPAAGGADRYPGDFVGLPSMQYAPHLDGKPDCGEVVWTWVPYEEDHSRGKDRPVLLIGTDPPYLLALQLTSKDHDRDAAQERRAGREWMDLGSGPWDAQGRPSEVRLNRIIRVRAEDVRREGAVLDRDRFDQVATAVRRVRG